MADVNEAKEEKKTKAKAKRKSKAEASKQREAARDRRRAAFKRDPYRVVLHPMVTEKTMFNMDKNNSLEFHVATDATKPEIAAAVEELFTVEVAKVTTRSSRQGKRAIVKFTPDHSAEDVGTRIGVF